jgi:hypothetical protein
VLALGVVPLGSAGGGAAAIAVALLAQGSSRWRLRTPLTPPNSHP